MDILGNGENAVGKNAHVDRIFNDGVSRPTPSTQLQDVAERSKKFKKINMKNKLIISFMAIMVILGAKYIKNTRHTGVENLKESAQQARPHEKDRHSETTAQEALPVALAEAKKWAKEPYLVKVTNFTDDDTKPYGKAPHWDFWFGTNEADEIFEVDILNGEVLRTDKPFSEKTTPLAESWMDSPEAIQIAGEKIDYDNCKSVWMGLSQDKWNIKCAREDQAPLWVLLNAKTGKIEKTRTGY